MIVARKIFSPFCSSAHESSPVNSIGQWNLQDNDNKIIFVALKNIPRWVTLRDTNSHNLVGGVKGGARSWRAVLVVRKGGGNMVRGES